MFCILIYLDIGRSEKRVFFSDFFPGYFLGQTRVFFLKSLHWANFSEFFFQKISKLERLYFQTDVKSSDLEWLSMCALSQCPLTRRDGHNQE